MKPVMIYSFEKLKAWQEARNLAKDIYMLINKFPKVEQFALCDQMRRAAISIPSNIAEGNARTSSKERIHFLEFAYGSLMEIYCQSILANDLGYIDNCDLDYIKEKIQNVSKLISGLKTSLEKR